MTYENAEETAEFIRSKYNRDLRAAVVLGSGLGAFADELQDPVIIPYEEVPHFQRSTVKGHAGRLVLGEIDGVPVIVQQGRFHYYEGYEMAQVIFPVRVLGVLGLESLVLTNAAGSVNTDFQQGKLMLIRDHINLMGVNPLRGEHDERFGERFPDMTEIYSLRYQEIAIAAAEQLAMENAPNTVKPKRLLRRGVYCGLSGPSYETPAEIRMLRMLGADAVGMSTVPESIAARQAGIKVLGISCVTNMAAGISDGVINHDEVMETGARVADVFNALLKRIIPGLQE